MAGSGCVSKVLSIEQQKTFVSHFLFLLKFPYRCQVSPAVLSENSRLVLIPAEVEIPAVKQLVAGDFHMVALTRVSTVLSYLFCKCLYRL